MLNTQWSPSTAIAMTAITKIARAFERAAKRIHDFQYRASPEDGIIVPIVSSSSSSSSSPSTHVSAAAAAAATAASGRDVVPLHVLVASVMPDVDAIVAQQLRGFIVAQGSKAHAWLVNSVELDAWVRMGSTSPHSSSVIDLFSAIYPLIDLFFSTIRHPVLVEHVVTSSPIYFFVSVLTHLVTSYSRVIVESCNTLTATASSSSSSSSASLEEVASVRPTLAARSNRNSIASSSTSSSSSTSNNSSSSGASGIRQRLMKAFKLTKTGTLHLDQASRNRSAGLVPVAQGDLSASIYAPSAPTPPSLSSLLANTASSSYNGGVDVTTQRIERSLSNLCVRLSNLTFALTQLHKLDAYIAKSWRKFEYYVDDVVSKEHVARTSFVTAAKSLYTSSRNARDSTRNAAPSANGGAGGANSEILSAFTSYFPGVTARFDDELLMQSACDSRDLLLWDRIARVRNWTAVRQSNGLVFDDQQQQQLQQLQQQQLMSGISPTTVAATGRASPPAAPLPLTPAQISTTLWPSPSPSSSSSSSMSMSTSSPSSSQADSTAFAGVSSVLRRLHALMLTHNSSLGANAAANDSAAAVAVATLASPTAGASAAGKSRLVLLYDVVDEVTSHAEALVTYLCSEIMRASWAPPLSGHVVASVCGRACVAASANAGVQPSLADVIASAVTLDIVSTCVLQNAVTISGDVAGGGRNNVSHARHKSRFDDDDDDDDVDDANITAITGDDYADGDDKANAIRKQGLPAFIRGAPLPGVAAGAGAGAGAAGNVAGALVSIAGVGGHAVSHEFVWLPSPVVSALTSSTLVTNTQAVHALGNQQQQYVGANVAVVKGKIEVSLALLLMMLDATTVRIVIPTLASQLAVVLETTAALRSCALSPAASVLPSITIVSDPFSPSPSSTSYAPLIDNLVAPPVTVSARVATVEAATARADIRHAVKVFHDALVKAAMKERAALGLAPVGEDDAKGVHDDDDDYDDEEEEEDYGLNGDGGGAGVITKAKGMRVVEMKSVINETSRLSEKSWNTLSRRFEPVTHPYARAVFEAFEPLRVLLLTFAASATTSSSRM